MLAAISPAVMRAVEGLRLQRRGQIDGRLRSLSGIGTQKTLVLLIFLSTPTNKQTGLFLPHLWTHRRSAACLCMGFVLQASFLMWGVLCQMLLSAGNEQLGVFLHDFVRVLELKNTPFE